MHTITTMRLPRGVNVWGLQECKGAGIVSGLLDYKDGQKFELERMLIPQFGSKIQKGFLPFCT